MRFLGAAEADERHYVQQPNQGGGSGAVANKDQGFQAQAEINS
jgi:hypothetical protein